MFGAAFSISRTMRPTFDEPGDNSPESGGVWGDRFGWLFVGLLSGSGGNIGTEVPEKVCQATLMFYASCFRRMATHFLYTFRK